MINNKPHIRITEIPTHSVEWFAFRDRGLGGSDIGAIMDLNEYKAGIRVFYEKIGRADVWSQQSQPAFHGVNLEKYVRKLWTHYDGSTEGYVNNYNTGKVIRRAKAVGGYITNDKYPHLFASLDGLIAAGSHSLISGEKLEMDCPLECKTMSLFVERKWINGIPATYLAQVHVYMILTETNYCEICILIDNKRLEVKPVIYDEKFGNLILKEAHDFWYNRVVPAKKAAAKSRRHEYNGEYDLMQDCEQEIFTYEPDPISSEDYKNFMKESALLEDVEVTADDDMFANAAMHKVYHGIEKLAKGGKLLYENRMIKFLKDRSAQKLKLGEAGTVTCRPNKNGEIVFRNNYKYGPSDRDLKLEFRKMDLKRLE